MRTRRFANSEKFRSKDRRLHQVLKRRDFALVLKTLPKGVLEPISHTTAGTASTIHTPLRALVQTAEETWKVDFADTPDPTGGYDDVVIPAAKQIGELASDGVVSFVGQSVGTYIVYAQHSLDDENPEQRDPPGKFAGGTGVFTEHADFFGHGKSEGTPIPREGYDDTLSSEIISEAVDRLTIAFAAEGSVPANATPLVSVVWNGTAVVSSQSIARVVDLTTLYDHIAAGGSAHSLATASTAGFMSAADKQALDGATSNVTANALAKRDASGRIGVGTPSANTDAATKGYVDTKVSAIPTATPSVAGLMSGPDKTKLDNATDANAVGTIVQRDMAGRFRGTRPSQFTAEVANKEYVDRYSFDVAVMGIEGGRDIPGGSNYVALQIAVTTASFERLVLKRVRYVLGSTSERCRVDTPTGGSWTSTNSSGDVAPETVLAEGNNTHTVRFRFVNGAGVSANIGAVPAGFVASFAIETG